MPTAPQDQTLRQSKREIVADEPHYLIVLEGSFPSEPIEPPEEIDIQDPPSELVGSYLVG